MIDPRTYTATEWMQRVGSALSFTSFLISNDAQWKDWALYVMSYPQVSQFSPPDPRLFENWMDWAIRFNQCVPYNY